MAAKQLQRFLFSIFVLVVLALSVGCQSNREAVSKNYIDVADEYWRQMDYPNAMEWYLKAADHPSAQYKIGVMYSYGQGVSQDYAEATKWFRKAAHKGVANAQYSMGLRYARGESVPKDFAEAAKWFRKAADQGVANAQFSLGLRYANGEGVKRDLVEAYKWFTISAKQGNQKVLTANRAPIAKQMTPDQIEEAERRAAAFVPKRVKI